MNEDKRAPVATRGATPHDPDSSLLWVVTTLAESAAPPLRSLDDRPLTGRRRSPPREGIPRLPSRSLLPLRLGGEMLTLDLAVTLRVEPAHPIDRLLWSAKVCVARASSLTAAAPHTAFVCGDCDLILVKEIALKPDLMRRPRALDPAVITHDERAPRDTAHP